MKTDKIKWKQIPWWLQVEIIFGGTIFSIWIMSFMIGFIVGIVEAL